MTTSVVLPDKVRLKSTSSIQVFNDYRYCFEGDIQNIGGEELIFAVAKGLKKKFIVSARVHREIEVLGTHQCGDY